MSSTFLQDVVSTVTAPISVGAKILAPLTDPIVNRLQASGLLGGGRAKKTAGPSIDVAFRNQQGQISQDWKVRISVAPGSGLFYHKGQSSEILAPLNQTNGVIFPYTPEITVSYQSNYQEQKFTHSNYSQYSYDQSEVQAIQIGGDFTAQNTDEANYVLACIYFFRAATKMFFATGENVGNPPPLVYLNGYGRHYLPNVPCVITSFSHTMPGDVDYIETGIVLPTSATGVNYEGQMIGMLQNRQRINPETGQPYSMPGNTAGTRIPTLSKITVNLRPVYSKSKITEFNLQDFAAGKLVDKGFI